MIRTVDLVSYLPPYLQNYKEQVAALAAEDPEFLLIWNAVDHCLYNHFISTADEYGISRYEQLMGLVPEEDDNLESRRSRVQVNWVNLLPYTIKTFLQKLNALCGANNYIVSGSFSTEYLLTIITYLENIGQVDDLNELFNEILPCNLVVDSTNQIICTVVSNNRFAARMTTHAQVSITQDWCETFRPRGGASAGVISSTEMYQITSENH